MNGRLPSTKQCFFCGHAKGGLALELQYIDGVAICEFTARDNFQGYEGMLHAGIITGILDEVMWWTLFMETKVLCATWKMEIKFERPVVCGKTYRASGHLLRTTLNTYHLTGIIEDGSGKTCAQGNASFRRMRGMSLEDITKHLDFRGISPEMQSLFQALKA
jgi:uncharacterized protein (TIGR00369 family)